MGFWGYLFPCLSSKSLLRDSIVFGVAGQFTFVSPKPDKRRDQIRLGMGAKMPHMFTKKSVPNRSIGQAISTQYSLTTSVCTFDPLQKKRKWTFTRIYEDAQTVPNPNPSLTEHFRLDPDLERNFLLRKTWSDK